MPGENFVSLEKQESKYSKIKSLVPTPTDDRKELRKMKKEVGGIISDMEKKIKKVPSLADVKDGSGRTMGAILALLKEALACINDLLSGKAASFQGFNVPNLAALVGPYGEYMAAYKALKPGLEKQYNDYAKQKELEKNKEMTAYFDFIDSYCSKIKAALEFAPIELLQTAYYDLKYLEAAIGEDFRTNGGISKRCLEWYNKSIANLRENESNFENLAAQSKLGSITNPPQSVLSNIRSLVDPSSADPSGANARASLSAITSYIKENGFNSQFESEAILYKSPGVRINGRAFGTGVIFNIYLEGSNYYMSVVAKEDGTVAVNPPKGDNDLFAANVSKFKDFLPEGKIDWENSVKRINSTTELPNVEKFAAEVLAQLSSMGFNTEGFSYPKFAFFPKSHFFPDVSGWYLSDSHTIELNEDKYAELTDLEQKSLICHEFMHAFSTMRKNFSSSMVSDLTWFNERATDIVSEIIFDKLGLSRPSVVSLSYVKNGNALSRYSAGYDPSQTIDYVRFMVNDDDLFIRTYQSGDLDALARAFCMAKRGKADDETLLEFYKIIQLPVYDRDDDRLMLSQLKSF